jgi:hypothetical protein
MIARKRMLGAAALWLAAISSAGLAAGAAPAEVKAPRQESFDRYQVLLSNNIFVRDHARWAPKGPVSAGPALTPEEATALRGIVRQGEDEEAEYFVFLEDLRTQQTTEMRVGDPVCSGKLVNPTLESVDYLKNGVAKRIEIGQNLTGKEAVAPAPPAEDQPARAGGPGGPPASAEGGNAPNSPAAVQGGGASPPFKGPALSPEQLAEKMRQKRLKDLGK